MSARCGRRPLAEVLTRRREWITTVIDTLSGLDGKINQATRRTEERSPPHLPLPPPLPYAPTSTPFLRHVQILEESLLSPCPEASWNIFIALHEDLRKTHLPPDTLRALLSKQVGRVGHAVGEINIRWHNVVHILDIMQSMGVRGNREDLETIISKAIDVGGTRKTKKLKYDILLSIWNALSEAHTGRLQSITPRARERWLMYRLRKCRPQAKQKPSESHVLGALRAEWRQLAVQGFFQRITLPFHVATILFEDYRLHIKEIMETLRLVHDNGGIITLEARSVWREHLESRLADFDTPDIQTYEYMTQVMGTDSMARMDPFDALVRDALHEAIADITGGVNAIALLLYLPSESTGSTRQLEGSSQASYEKALHFARRRIKRIPTQPTEEQAPHVVTTLAFGAVIIKDAINQGEPISDHLVVTVFRGFKYLPGWLRTDDRYARRLQFALVLLMRSLRRRNRTLKQWQSSWPTMLEALGGYASTKEILSQSIWLYRQMQTAKSTDYAGVLAAFRHDRLRNADWEDQPRKTLDAPWHAMELYVDAIRAGARNLDGTRTAIVHRFSGMRNAAYLQHLRTTATRYRGSDEARPIVLELLHDAIGECRSPDLITGLYDISSEISTPTDSALAETLDLLISKMKELGDEAHRQFAINRAEVEWERGVRLSRRGMETLVLLVNVDTRESSIDAKVERLAQALATGERLVLRSHPVPDSMN
ncbi:hypothetical protein QFC21_005162 [Naganishia friedmannii]|uniref:Uncharacterized protein n=1 Tax=Naganishia friedmannii TaxID=89922 RepID=A0ACC2VBK8_9TREE|nr:hypothetical protein QFC21_005162 [Naganishia friedmannii]